MSAGDGATAAGGHDAHARGIQVPCLHNPTRHELDFHLSRQDFAWIDLEGPTEQDLADVTRHIKLHPLTLEDAKTFGQRPKIEDYDDYVYMVVCGVDPGTETGGPLLREVHLIIAADAVVTIHRRPCAPLDRLRARYTDTTVRSKLFFTYEIVGAMVATFDPVLGRIDDQIDAIEERIVDQPVEADLREIFSIKRDLVGMRRVITPMRDMFQRREDHLSEVAGDEADDLFYFRDLYDGLIRTSEMVDGYRDLLSGATDLYLSTVANRQGEVNRQLTIVATIFLPLTFLTGFFGQNFGLLVNNLIAPSWTFWAFGIGLLVLSAVLFVVWFRSRGWIGRDATGGDAHT